MCKAGCGIRINDKAIELKKNFVFMYSCQRKLKCQVKPISPKGSFRSPKNSVAYPEIEEHEVTSVPPLHSPTRLPPLRERYVSTGTSLLWTPWAREHDAHQASVNINGVTSFQRWICYTMKHVIVLGFS